MTLTDFIIEHIAQTDAQIAELANTPTLAPKPHLVTFRTMAAGVSGGGGLGLARAGEIIAAIQQNMPVLASMLMGLGINPADEQVPAVAAQLVGASILTQAEAETLLYNKSWPTERTGDVTEQEVADLRPAAERTARLTALREQINTARATFFNEAIQAALDDPEATEPVLADFLAMLEGNAE